MTKERIASIKSSSIGLLLTIILSFLLGIYLPDDVSQFGLFSLVPAFYLITYIFITKRILEALTFASLMCFAMADKGSFFSAFNDGLVSVMLDKDMAWLIIVCGLMGSIIALIEKAGGSFAFGSFISKHAKTRKGTLVWTWLLGVVVFIDDYLSSLTVGSCMTKGTDRNKVSRELLSFIVDSTAAPICVLVPLSTWSVFVSRLIYINGLSSEEDSLAYFISTIPFNFYSWAAALLVLFVVLGWFPLIGKMKKAEGRALSGGPLAPAGSEKIDIHSSGEASVPEDSSMLNFALPMICLVVSTILSDMDMQKGVLITLGFMFLLYVFQGLMSAEEFADTCVEGMKSMLLPLLLMVLAFLFSYAADRINFTMCVINTVVPLMKNTPQLMPLLVFLVLGMTEFITGTNWGMYIIALPIVIPLSQAVGGNTLLAVSAVLSAGVLGSHICFYSDATILSSSACGCNNFEHAASQMPYGLIEAGIASVGFLVAGFVVG